MNRELLAVVGETPVKAVRELLRTFGLGAVPVVDDERRPIGMVRTRAVLDGGGTAGERMTRPAVCAEGSTAIDEGRMASGLRSDLQNRPPPGGT